MYQLNIQYLEFTLLRIAVILKQVDTVKLLLQNGAAPCLPFKNPAINDSLMDPLMFSILVGWIGNKFSPEYKKRIKTHYPKLLDNVLENQNDKRIPQQSRDWIKQHL